MYRHFQEPRNEKKYDELMKQKSFEKASSTERFDSKVRKTFETAFNQEDCHKNSNKDFRVKDFSFKVGLVTREDIPSGHRLKTLNNHAQCLINADRNIILLRFTTQECF